MNAKNLYDEGEINEYEEEDNEIKIMMIVLMIH